MILAGVDYSITCPAICVYDPDLGFSYYAFPSTATKKLRNAYESSQSSIMTLEYQHKKDTFPHDIARFDAISDWAMSVIRENKVGEVGMEGYSMGSKGKVFNLAENMGMFKYKVYKEGIPYSEIAPKSIKKSFVGNGNAKKEEMLEQFVKENGDILHRPLELDTDKLTSPINDMVDAYAIIQHMRYT
jgi:Holliday junction resolvasome RuvABC endonuclease subunit